MSLLGPLRGRPCTVCNHKQEREITTALLAGGSCREVAKRYKIAVSTLARHNRRHLKTRVARAEAAIGQPAQMRCAPGGVEAEVIAAPRLRRVESYEVIVDVAQSVRGLYVRTLNVLESAESSGDLSTALKAIREARGTLELLGRLDGSLGGPVSPIPTKIEIEYVDKQLLPGVSVRSLEVGK